MNDRRTFVYQTVNIWQRCGFVSLRLDTDLATATGGATHGGIAEPHLEGQT